MKRICFILFCVCFVACQQSDLVFDHYQESETLVLDNDTLLEITAGFHYPDGLLLTQYQKEIGSFIIEQVFGKAYMDQGNKAAAKYVEQAYFEYKKKAQESASFLRNTEKIQTRITYLNDSLIEYSIERVCSYQNAQAITTYRNLVIDLSQAKLLNYYSVFDATKQDDLRNILWKELHHRWSEYLLLEDDFAMNVVESRLLDSNFEIHVEGIEFIYNPYELFGNNQQAIRFVVPKDIVYPILIKGTSVWQYYNQLMKN